MPLSGHVGGVEFNRYMLDAERFRRLGGEHHLILAVNGSKSDGESHDSRRVFAGQRRDDRGVDPCREKDAHRHVGDEMPQDGVVEHVVDGARGLNLMIGQRLLWKTPETARPRRDVARGDATIDPLGVPGGERPDVLVDRAW